MYLVASAVPHVLRYNNTNVDSATLFRQLLVRSQSPAHPSRPGQTRSQRATHTPTLSDSPVQAVEESAAAPQQAHTTHHQPGVRPMRYNTVA